MTRHWRCLESNFTVDDSGLPIWWKFTFPQGGGGAADTNNGNWEGEKLDTRSSDMYLLLQEDGCHFLGFNWPRDTQNQGMWVNLPHLQSCWWRIWRCGLSCGSPASAGLPLVPPLPAMLQPLSYHWIPLPPLAASFRIIIKCMGCWKIRQKMELCWSSADEFGATCPAAERNSGQAFHVPWSVHPWDRTSEASPRPLWVISGRLGPGLGLHAEMSGSGLCVSDSKERIRNLKGLAWSQRRPKPHLVKEDKGVMRRGCTTGDFRLEQLWQAS